MPATPVLSNERSRWILLIGEIIQQLILLRIQAQNSGDDELEADALSAIQSIEAHRAKLLELILAQIADSDRLTTIVAALKSERSHVRAAIDDGIDTADELLKVNQSVATATNIFNSLKEQLGS